MMDEKLLNLPWEIQIAIGGGYLAYMLAYTGIRDHHKAVDVTFRTIAFGLFSTAVLALVPARLGWFRIVSAVLVAVVAGAIWRRWVAQGVQRLIRAANISWSDDTPSAWSRITQHNSSIYYSQLLVHLDDDSCVFCNNTLDFKDAPFGPCTLGPSGDIALYVTHRSEPGAGAEFEPVEGVSDPIHGYELSYIPAARIRRIKVRLLAHANDEGAAAAGH